MNFEEYAAKPVLAAAGISVPPSRVAKTPEDAFKAAEAIGKVVVKAQVPTGKRGKAGGIKLAGTPEEARDAAKAILGMTIGEHTVEKLLVEAQAPIDKELYAAVLNDSETRGPMVLFSTLGGMDVEEAAEQDPNQVRRQPVDIRTGLDKAGALKVLDGLDLGNHAEAIADTLVKLYGAYRKNDAELLEIN
ncbi:MAG: ATP-grasp domain-containing protein, partial [Rhodospirillales bacterium]